MFDKPSPPPPTSARRGRRARVGPEDERIALRCHRRELRLLDTFVASGEFPSRSELMRAALLEFLRARSAGTALPPAAVAPAGLAEVPVRLRQEEVETLRLYAHLVGNDRPLGDLLAELVRRGESDLHVAELVSRHRGLTREAAEQRASVGELQRSGEDLARRGVVGR